MKLKIYRNAAMILSAFALLSAALPANASQTKMRNLSNGYADGGYPVGALVNNAGTFYGFTQYGQDGAGYGSMFKMTTTGTVTTLVNFTGGATSPYQPAAGPVLTSTNTYYGTSIYGGTSGTGTIFKAVVSGSTATVTVVHSFTGGAADGQYAYAGLIKASDGLLYGTTLYGGANNQGIVYSFDPASSTFTIRHSFNSSADIYYGETGVCEGPDGKLYGSNPYCAGFNGGVYRINKDGTGYSLVYGFSSTDPAGYNPWSDLVKGNDGKLYGTCYSGGANGIGTIFRVNTAGAGSVEPVWSFTGFEGASPGYPYATNPQVRMTTGIGNLMYGATRAGGLYGYGTIFKLDTSTNTATLLGNLAQTNGDQSLNPLVLNGATLYATSYYGGLSGQSGPGGSPTGWGSTVSCTTTGTLKLLHSWYIQDGYFPYDSPTAPISGYCYGTTYYGGQFSVGTIYKIGTTGSFTYSVLHSFNNYLLEGAYPWGGLFKAADGALYGTTSGGGLFGYGTIFKVTTSGVLTVLHHFRASQECYSPYRKLVQGYGTDKNLYGTCWVGGPAGYGSVFKIDTAGKTFQIIHYFGNLDGRNSACQLTVENDGITTKYLYGTTYAGGTSGVGTLFRMNSSGTSYTVLHNFTGGTDGSYPGYFGGPMPELSGVLYGTTYTGGTAANGVLWKYDTTTSTFTPLHQFNNAVGEGYYPYGGVSTDGVGNFYGTCYYGAVAGMGTVWKYNPGSSTFTVLHTFTGSPDGAYPQGGVVYDTASGLLWGTTSNGGTTNQGTIFNQTTAP